MTERLSTHTCWPKVLLYGFPPLGCLSDLLSQFILTKCGKNDGILLHRFSYKKTVISSLLDTCLPPSPISLSLCFSVSMWLYVSFYVCFKEASCHMAPNYSGGNEDNGDLLQNVPCTHHHTQCPPPCSSPPLTHASAGDSWTFRGRSESVSCVVTAPFSWVLVCTRFCLCPPRVCFPSPV